MELIIGPEVIKGLKVRADLLALVRDDLLKIANGEAKINEVIVDISLRVADAQGYLMGLINVANEKLEKKPEKPNVASDKPGDTHFGDF